MTGYELYRQALSLLNYSAPDGGVTADADLHKRALPVINQIYADLWGIRSTEQFFPLASLTQQINLDSYTLTNVMPYGVAMLIAQTDGDGENQAVYATLYNQRRSSVRTQTERIIDRQPHPYL